MNPAQKYGVAAAAVVLTATAVTAGVLRGDDTTPTRANPVPGPSDITSATTAAASPGFQAPPSTGEFVPGYYRKWPDSLPPTADFFPIGVWMQDPNRQRGTAPNAVNYRQAGINTFIGQWDFPTRADSASRLATLRKHGLHVLAGDEAVASALKKGAVAGPDPWKANTLEWYTTSPPPEHNFDVIPRVRSVEPMKDLRRQVEQESGQTQRHAPSRALAET